MVVIKNNLWTNRSSQCCTCRLPLYLVCSNLYKPQTIRLSHLTFSPSSVILCFSQQILFSTFSSNLFPSCNVTSLPSLTNAPSFSEKSPSSFNAQQSAPSSSKPHRPKTSVTPPPKDEVIDSSKAIERDQSLINTSASSVCAKSNPSAFAP